MHKAIEPELSYEIAFRSLTPCYTDVHWYHRRCYANAHKGVQ